MSVPAIALRAALEPLNVLLDRMERRSRPTGRVLRHPPVFIIGSPRSGSTLLYQMLVASFRFGFLSNLHCRLYGGPVVTQRVFGRWIRGYQQANLSSTDGHSAGLMGPSECGRFWYRWFPRSPQYVRAEQLSATSLASLRAVIESLTVLWDAPMLFKNLTCGMRLQVLGPLFPEALFLVIRRDPFWTAQSLLHGRQRTFGDVSKWWSTQPPNVDELSQLSPEEQVVGQVTSIYRTIDADAKLVGAHRFLSIDYDQLCTEPQAVMATVHSFFRENGLNVASPRPLPEHPVRVERSSLSPSQLDRIRDALSARQATQTDVSTVGPESREP